MNHDDHVRLIQDGISALGGVWADFGSGGGAFTLALAECIKSTGIIYSIDKDRAALKRQERSFQSRFPEQTVYYHAADFTHSIILPLLDGILMANSLHFVFEKDPVLNLIRSYLRPGGRVVIVEYNSDHGNSFVPYPFSFQTWKELANRAGFIKTEKLAVHPTRFMGQIYSAVSWIRKW